MDTAADKRKRLFSYETDILVETTYVDVVKPLPEGSIGMKSRNSGWDEGKESYCYLNHNYNLSSEKNYNYLKYQWI